MYRLLLLLYYYRYLGRGRNLLYEVNGLYNTVYVLYYTVYKLQYKHCSLLQGNNSTNTYILYVYLIK